MVFRNKQDNMNGMIYKVNCKTNEAVANKSGAMEAETISKHGASSKSHMSRGNFLILAL